MADLDPAQEIELLELLNMQEADAPASPSGATFGEKAAEVGRSVGRGVKNMGEALIDTTWDVGMAAIPRPGVTPLQTGKNVLNELNPFGEADGADKTREEFYNRPLMQSLTGEKLARNEDPILDSLKTAGEWAPTLVNPTQSLARNLATVVTGSAGAAGGEQIGGEAGEVIGGIVGSLAGNRTGEAVQSLVKWFRRQGANIEKAEQDAAAFMRDNVADIEAASAKVRAGVDAGEQGTTGQLAADTNILSIEAGANTTPEAIMSQRAARQGRTNQIVDDVKGAFGPELVGAERALPQASERVAQQVGASEGRLSQALAGETDAADVARIAEARVAPNSATFEASEELAKVLDTTQASYDAAYKIPAWKEFDALRGKTGAIDSAPFKNQLKLGLAKLSPTERSVFNDTYMKEFNFIEGLNDTIRPSEVAFLISRIKTVTGNAARTNSTSATEKFLTDIGLRLEKKLRSTDGAGALYDNALAATKESTARFSARNVGAARLDPNVETLGARLVLPGDAGAATAGDLANAGPEVVTQTGQYLKSLAAREGLNADFIQKYEGFLSRFPDQALVAEMRSAASAERGLVQAKAAATDVAKVEGEVQQGLTKTAMSEFATAPDATMKRMINNPVDLGPRLDELMNTLDNPTAVRDAFRDTFVSSMSTEVGGVNKVTPKAIDAFNDALPALQRLFKDAPEELAKIQTAVERSGVDLLRESIPGTKLASGIDEMDSLLASGAAATVLSMGFTGTHSLMVGGAIRRAIMRTIGKSDVNPDTMHALSEMVAKPEEFLRIMSNAPKVSGSAGLVGRMTSALEAVLQPGFAGFVNADIEG